MPVKYKTLRIPNKKLKWHIENDNIRWLYNGDHTSYLWLHKTTKYKYWDFIDGVKYLIEPNLNNETWMDLGKKQVKIIKEKTTKNHIIKL